MIKNKTPAVNTKYIIGVSLLLFVLPVVVAFSEASVKKHTPITFLLIAKWFIFFAAARLFIAGIKQTADPAFTATQIFYIDRRDAFPIIRELGFANICLGLIGIISLWLPEWRIVSAFAGGLYYGLAGIMHIVKKPVGVNEQFALITDVVVFLLLLTYCVYFV